MEPAGSSRGQEVLVVNDLVVGYDQPLLPEINLRVKLGEKIAVTGFNGIGKTTFLKTICGILPELKTPHRCESDSEYYKYNQN